MSPAFFVDAFSSYRTALFSPTKNGLISQLSRYLLWHCNYTERHPQFFQMVTARNSVAAACDARRVPPCRRNTNPFRSGAPQVNLAERVLRQQPYVSHDLVPGFSCLEFCLSRLCLPTRPPCMPVLHTLGFMDDPLSDYSINSFLVRCVEQHSGATLPALEIIYQIMHAW